MRTLIFILLMILHCYWGEEKDKIIEIIKSTPSDILKNFPGKENLWQFFKESNPDKAVEQYDFVLDVKRLDDLKDGWNLIFKNSDEKTYWTNLQVSPALWGVGGSKFDVGKSWFIGQLLGKNYPEGYTEEAITRGLSFIHHKSSNGHALVVDSMGKDRPLFDVNVHQRVTMDAFVTEFLQKMSKKFLYVVPTLGASDIEDTNKVIAETFSKSSNNVSIVIIHNFRELYEDKDIQFHIEQDIIEAFSDDQNLSKEDCEKLADNFQLHWEMQYKHQSLPLGRAPIYLSDKKCRIFPTQIRRGVWINTYHNDDNFRRYLVHVVFVNEKSSVADQYNNKSLDYLKSQLEADLNNVVTFPFLETLKKTTRGILYNHLYTPDEAKSDIPVAFNIAEVKYFSTGLKSYLFYALDEIVNLFDILFTKAKSVLTGIWYFVFGKSIENAKLQDPFSLTISPKQESENTLLLKLEYEPETPLVYAPLDPQYIVDKYYYPKMDVLTSPESTIYILDMAGVPKGNVTVDCYVGDSFFRIYGMKPIPKIYSRYIEKRENIIKNERRFSSFSISVWFTTDHVCLNPLRVELENGALYVVLPKKKNILTGDPFPVSELKKDEL